jgi:DNA-directed RNA polymerase specialized sigma24 family protein
VQPDPRAQDPVLFIRPPGDDTWYEPTLAGHLSALPERQRIAVVLIHGYGWSSTEVAAMTGLRRSTIQTHLERGLATLRSRLRVSGTHHA